MYLRYVNLYGIVIWFLVPEICPIFQVYSGILLTSFEVNKVLYFVLRGTCCSTLGSTDEYLDGNKLDFACFCTLFTCIASAVSHFHFCAFIYKFVRKRSTCKNIDK